MWQSPLWKTTTQPEPSASNLNRTGSGSQRGETRPATAATDGPFATLKDKSVEELRAILLDPTAYKNYLFSVVSVASAIALRKELQTSNLEQAERSLFRESEIAELRNQCTIIRTTELATAQERFEELRKQELKVHGNCSPSSLSEQLRKAAEDADRESDDLQRRFLEGDMEISEYIAQYKKLRVLYHMRILTRQAAGPMF